MNYGQGRKLCAECVHGKDKGGGGCYCIKYGFVIGYQKEKCRGFEREQVQKSENRG